MSRAVGVWDTLRGQSSRIRQENEQDAWQSLMRDRAEKDALIFRHLEERRDLRKILDREHAANRKVKSELRDQVTDYDAIQAENQRKAMRAFLREQLRDRSRDGPDYER